MMKVRVFFEDETTQDVSMQTYFNQDDGILIVHQDGKEELFQNVSHMIKIADW